jgi:glycosyltransferase involved in cell wall biosynthesis
MKILFILYNDFKSNSTIHVYHYANALVKAGCMVVVAVPFGEESYKEVGLIPLFEITLFDDLLSKHAEVAFDIIHVWTPREIVRKFYNRIKNVFKNSKLIIHLEDNEDAILNLSIEASEITKHHIPDHLSDPLEYKRFLNISHGITVLMDTLAEFAPEQKPVQMIWPIIDEKKFDIKVDSEERRLKYGIGKNDLVIAYTGNVHSANYEEVRSLYLAVALANRQGIRVKLIRTGVDYYNLYENKSKWDFSLFIELGFVSYNQIPVVLSSADMLIQPGEPSNFNDYRLPSKLPEFLMSGKPVILPNTNLARFMKENSEALFLSKGDALEILEKIKLLHSNRELGKTIGDNGLKFAKANFNEEKNCVLLLRYYQKIIETK